MLRVPMSACCAQAWLTGVVCKDRAAGGVRGLALPEYVVTKRASARFESLVPARGGTPPGTSSRRASSWCQCAADGEGRQPGTSATDEVTNYTRQLVPGAGHAVTAARYNRAKQLRERCAQVRPGSRYVASAAVAVVTLAVFAAVAAVAAKPLASVLRDNITFTRKDFVPYSERRRCALAVTWVLVHWHPHEYSGVCASRSALHQARARS